MNAKRSLWRHLAKKQTITCILFLCSAAVAQAQECGQSGSIDSRISQCRTTRISSKGFLWSLVVRDSRNRDVWIDQTSHTLWGATALLYENEEFQSQICRSDNCPVRTKENCAMASCAGDMKKGEKVCFLGQPFPMKDFNGRLPFSFHLPSYEETNSAYQHGMEEILEQQGVRYLTYSVRQQTGSKQTIIPYDKKNTGDSDDWENIAFQGKEVIRDVDEVEKVGFYIGGFDAQAFRCTARVQ